MSSLFALPQSLTDSLNDTKVDYVRLGSSGLKVSVPILGAMSLGASDLVEWVVGGEAAHALLHAAFQRGLNTWDTANTYSSGLSEQTIGDAMKKYNIPRQKVIIMTKCSQFVGEEPKVVGNAFGDMMAQSKDYVNQGGLSRSAIFTAVEHSLARLQTTYIDVLQIHRYDPATPHAETMKALHDLVESGKVRYIGASSMWATQFAQLQFVAEKNNWTKFISMQNYYNLLYREEEREMIRFCKDTGVGLTPWSPLFAGRLARPLGDLGQRSQRATPHQPGLTAADEEIIKRVEEIAKKRDWKMAHVALAWHLSKGAIPIVGINSMDKLEDACAMRGKTLTEEEVHYLEEPYVARAIIVHK